MKITDGQIVKEFEHNGKHYQYLMIELFTPAIRCIETGRVKAFSLKELTILAKLDGIDHLCRADLSTEKKKWEPPAFAIRPDNNEYLCNFDLVKDETPMQKLGIEILLDVPHNVADIPLITDLLGMPKFNDGRKFLFNSDRATDEALSLVKRYLKDKGRLIHHLIGNTSTLMETFKCVYTEHGWYCEE
jgi:hypothetical protein